MALRYVGNSTDAQDVAQAVFIILAKRSASLRDKTVITGWLYETTRFSAINSLRSKIRRESREQEAYMESTLTNSDTASVWQQIAPPKLKNHFLPKESWVDAGFSTPEATLQTRGWTVLNADRDRIKESVLITDDGRKMLEDMLEKMITAAPDPAQARQNIEGNGLTLEDAMLFPMLAQNKSSGGFSGYQILSRQSPAENEQVMEVETQTSTGPAQRETLKFRRVDEGWKVVIDAERIRQT